MTKEDADFFRGLGLCSRCGKYKVFGDEKMCPECRAICANQEYARRHRDLESSRRHEREYQKMKRQSNIQNGMCAQCGKREPYEGQRLCARCREYSRQRKIRYRERNRDDTKIAREDRYANGMCWFCDNPIEKGYRVCEYHHRLNAESSRKGHDMRKLAVG